MQALSLSLQEGVRIDPAKPRQLCPCAALRRINNQPAIRINNPTTTGASKPGFILHLNGIIANSHTAFVCLFGADACMYLYVCVCLRLRVGVCV